MNKERHQEVKFCDDDTMDDDTYEVQSSKKKIKLNLPLQVRFLRGNLTADKRGRMFISMQTYKGLKIYVHSDIEAIQFLLAEGFHYVLSEHFMQDVLEDYFGHQRAICRYCSSIERQCWKKI